MNQVNRRKLQRAGFKLGSVQDFLGLSNEEMALIDLKVHLVEILKSTRKSNRITQQGLARLIASSQSRVAKMEAGAPDISLDLICRALFSLGISRQTLGRMIASKRAA
jgi:hypothetical protein